MKFKFPTVHLLQTFTPETDLKEGSSLKHCSNILPHLQWVKKVGCGFMNINPWINFCNPHWELICCNKWHLGTSEVSTPPGIIAGTHFHALHSIKTTTVFLFADRDLLVVTFNFGLLTIRQHSATRKHLLLYPQDVRSGMRSQKRDKYQH